jgi:20S proteasome alpha/beta subunit
MSIENLSKDELLDLVRSAIKEAVESNPLSDEEIKWVRMAIENEAKRAEFHKAIIEKTLGGLAWSALCGVGYLALDFVQKHWK